MRNTFPRRLFTASLVLAVAMFAASGCAALKAITPTLLEYGIEKAEQLAAGGKAAIEEARERAEAIPDAIDRQTALLEVIRAEQIYMRDLLEYLVSCHPPDMDGAPSDSGGAAPVAIGAGGSTDGP